LQGKNLIQDQILMIKNAFEGAKVFCEAGIQVLCPVVFVLFWVYYLRSREPKIAVFLDKPG